MQFFNFYFLKEVVKGIIIITLVKYKLIAFIMTNNGHDADLDSGLGLPQRIKDSD